MGGNYLTNKLITKANLYNFYATKHLSVSEIAKRLKCSENKINYWLAKYRISKRTIAEALYLKHNPNGDPFSVSIPKTIGDAVLYGLGLGLYWGEGNKRNKVSVRIGNTDPDLLLKFISFLEKICHIDKKKLKFSLQIFSDMPARRVVYFWSKKLKIHSSQLGKPVITPARSIGNYKEKSKYGVLTIYFHNRKLRDIICGEIEKLRMPL